MARVRVKLNHRGMRDLLGDPGVEAFLHAKMEPVLAAAEADAPVETGAYKDSLHIEDHHESSGRVVSRVVAGTDHALTVEATHGTLGRAMDAL